MCNRSFSLFFLWLCKRKERTKETPRESFARARAIQGAALKTRKVFEKP
jgi:hypothetical protein